MPMTAPRLRNSPITPNPDTVAIAQAALHRIGAHKPDGFALIDGDGSRIELNEQVFELLRSILIDIAMNRPIVLMPLSHELTTHQAAEMLNVSRGFVLSLIQKHELPCRMVGTHRRIRLEDILAYRERKERESEEAMQQLADLGQEMELD